MRISKSSGWQTRLSKLLPWDDACVLHTGKTILLYGLLQWLRDFLHRPEAKDEAELLDFIAWAMYGVPYSALGAEHVDMVCKFLGALRRTAGPPHHLAMLRQATWQAVHRLT